MPEQNPYFNRPSTELSTAIKAREGLIAGKVKIHRWVETSTGHIIREEPVNNGGLFDKASVEQQVREQVRIDGLGDWKRDELTPEEAEAQLPLMREALEFQQSEVAEAFDPGRNRPKEDVPTGDYL